MEDGVSQTVTIAAKAVNTLMQLNQPGNRENSSKDKRFIKSLLIALCTLTKIQSMDENQKFEKGILSFVKGDYFSFVIIFYQ